MSGFNYAKWEHIDEDEEKSSVDRKCESEEVPHPPLTNCSDEEDSSSSAIAVSPAPETKETDEQLESEIAQILCTSYAPSGDRETVESAESQLRNEVHLERVYFSAKAKRGVGDPVVLRLFLKLFDVWIGMYRLDKCDAELDVIYPEVTDSPTLGPLFEIKVVQALAFTRWKQSRFSEAIVLFKRMEEFFAGSPSVELYENMGHTYSSMSDYPNAETYFNRCLALNPSNRGGVLLGLGLLQDRRGAGNERKALKICMEALEWYQGEYSKAGRGFSSLEAKSSMSIAKLHLKLNEYDQAECFCRQAIEIFVVTCGEESPLVANASFVLGQILWMKGNRLEARKALKRAYELEAIKDSLDIRTLVEINNLLLDTLTKPLLIESSGAAPPQIVRSQFKEYLAIAVRACDNIRRKVVQDGNAAVFYKLTAELAVWAEDLPCADRLLKEAVPLFLSERSMDCTGLADQCKQIITLIESFGKK